MLLYTLPIRVKSSFSWVRVSVNCRRTALHNTKYKVWDWTVAQVVLSSRAYARFDVLRSLCWNRSIIFSCKREVRCAKHIDILALFSNHLANARKQQAYVFWNTCLLLGRDCRRFISTAHIQSHEIEFIILLFISTVRSFYSSFLHTKTSRAGIPSCV